MNVFFVQRFTNEKKDSFQQKKRRKVGLIFMNLRQEPYSENLTQEQTICLDVIVVKAFVEKSVKQNGCTTYNGCTE